MTTDEINEMLGQTPFTPLRITLSSGDQVILPRPNRAMVSGGMLYISGDVLEPDPRLGRRTKIVSTVNVAMVERVDDLPPAGRKRRRRG